MARSLLATVLVLLVCLSVPGTLTASEVAIRAYDLPRDGGYPHDVAVGPHGIIWYTAQRDGKLGRLDPTSGKVDLVPQGPRVWDAPRGRGPYGIATTPGGDVSHASLAGSHIARIDPETGTAAVIEPPTSDQGARRVWSDSRGRVWVSEWNSGNVSRYDPGARTWKLPGDRPHAYAVYVDDHDKVWLSEWEANAMLRFDPETETFPAFPSDRAGARVRQSLGRRGEVWAPESGADRRVVYRRK